jgi:hypothetical protein
VGTRPDSTSTQKALKILGIDPAVAWSWCQRVRPQVRLDTRDGFTRPTLV